MGEEDRADQAFVCYSATRKRQGKYNVVIFLYFLVMAVWNAFTLQKNDFTKADNHDFRRNLVQRIIEKF